MSFDRCENSPCEFRIGDGDIDFSTGHRARTIEVTRSNNNQLLVDNHEFDVTFFVVYHKGLSRIVLKPLDLEVGVISFCPSLEERYTTFSCAPTYNDRFEDHHISRQI